MKSTVRLIPCILASVERCSAFSVSFPSGRGLYHFRKISSLLAESSVLENLPDCPRERSHVFISVASNNDRTCKRFRHMVDLAIEHQQASLTIRSVTDVGCDHGLLAGALALSGRFDTVLGVDVSPNALSNGLRLQEKLKQGAYSFQGNDAELPLEFRLSDGLKTVQTGEADTVCIAGMGANVMMKILQASTDGIHDIDRLESQCLILQPTNSRPRNLFKLYHMLQTSDWELIDERIEYLLGRWYISCCFARPTQNKNKPESLSYPTSRLARLNEDDEMKRATIDYWRHHLNWIESEDNASNGNIDGEDAKWRTWILSSGFLR